MEELLIAPPTTVLESRIDRTIDDPPTQQLRKRPNQLFQGLLAFLAVVGIGSTITVVLSPPVQVRVVTVDRSKPPEIHYVERVVVEKQPVILPPAKRPPRGTLPPQAQPKPRTMPNSIDCKDDPLCGIDTGKQ